MRRVWQATYFTHNAWRVHALFASLLLQYPYICSSTSWFHLHLRLEIRWTWLVWYRKLYNWLASPSQVTGSMFAETWWDLSLSWFLSCFQSGLWKRSSVGLILFFHSRRRSADNSNIATASKNCYSPRPNLLESHSSCLFLSTPCWNGKDNFLYRGRKCNFRCLGVVVASPTPAI